MLDENITAKGSPSDYSDSTTIRVLPNMKFNIEFPCVIYFTSILIPNRNVRSVSDYKYH